MKKLLLLFLVLTGMVSTASAAELTTVYLNPSTNWKESGARFALFMYGTEGEEWVDFTNIEGDLYYAYFNKKYENMILCRMDGSKADNNWGNKWNQSADLAAPSKDAPVYIIGDGWDSPAIEKKSIDESGFTIHKIYVKNKGTGTPCFLEIAEGISDWGWSTVNYAWPGEVLSTTETISEVTWNVFKTLKKDNIKGRVMLDSWVSAEANFAESGDVVFDLSSDDAFYYYYPDVYQIVAKDDALETKGTAYFRGNNGANELKYYFWNHEGIRDNAFTTETVGDVEWLKLETYKPTIGIQFYTYDNGGTDTDKCWGQDAFPIETGTHYYFARMYNNADVSQGRAIHKYESTYYLVFGSDDGLTGGYIEMTPDGQFGQKVTLDNLAGNNVYYAIFPASAYNTGTKEVTVWNGMLCPWFVESGNYEMSTFEQHDCAILPTTWKRWRIKNVQAKYDISFNFASMMWSSKPHVTTTVSAAGYATYSKGAMYNIGAADAYVVETVNTGSVKMTQLPENTILPANAGIILAGTGDHEIYAAVWDAAARDNSANKLVGTGDGTATLDGTKKEYVLGNGASGIGFYKAAAGTLGANKAYLNLEGVEAPDFLGFDDATGISEINAETNLFGGAPIYNLQGVKLSKFQKGLNIVNGKKIIVQ